MHKKGKQRFNAMILFRMIINNKLQLKSYDNDLLLLNLQTYKITLKTHGNRH